MGPEQSPGAESSGAPDERAGRGDRIAVSSGDEAGLRLQLAARWAEAYAPEHGDSLVAALARFRRAYEYLDAVTHGVEPASLDQNIGPVSARAGADAGALPV